MDTLISSPQQIFLTFEWNNQIFIQRKTGR